MSKLSNSNNLFFMFSYWEAPLEVTSELDWGSSLHSFQRHTQGNLAGFISSLPDGFPDSGELLGLKQPPTLIDRGWKMSLQVNWGHLLRA